MFPWRPGGGDLQRHDKDSHDRHGIPRCKHCGGPSSFVRFSVGDRKKPAEERNPRLWYLCMLGSTPACAREQTIACSTDWRLLVPLWRTEALYDEAEGGAPGLRVDARLVAGTGTRSRLTRSRPGG